MVSKECVRSDLRDIRYYYARKKELDNAALYVGILPVKRTAERYNCVMREAPLKLCDLYACLYLRGQTQEAVAIELGYTPQYIGKLVVELINYLSENLD